MSHALSVCNLYGYAFRILDFCLVLQPREDYFSHSQNSSLPVLKHDISFDFLRFSILSLTFNFQQRNLGHIFLDKYLSDLQIQRHRCKWIFKNLISQLLTNRNVINFCILAFYFETWLNSFISYYNHSAGPLGLATQSYHQLARSFHLPC